MTTTLFFYVDALRYDYVSKSVTPFLSNLSQEGFYGRVKTVPGFTQEAAMITGKYPEETNHFTWFRYDPAKSPFSYLRPVRFLDSLRRTRLYYPVKVGVRKITQVITGDEYPDPAFIPIRFLPYFQNLSGSLPQNMPNLFSLCQNSGRSCFSQSLIYDFVGTVSLKRIFEKVYKSTNSGKIFDLYFVHIGELDGLGHKFGPHPLLFSNYLKEIDSWIRKIYLSITKKNKDCNIVVASDHGMFDVVGSVDIERRLSQLPLSCPKDYLYFLDSTIARFWFNTEKARKIVEATLLKVPNGHVLSDKEITDMHIRFKGNNYGEMLFWLDKGYIIYPNFFQTLKLVNTRGMHGYTNDTEGGIIIQSSNANIRKLNLTNVVPLVDIFRILRTLANF